MKAPRVLIADDDALVATAFARQFRRGGWEVVVTTAPNSVVGIAQSVMPDMVLLDVCQGEVNGIDLLRALKANPRTRSIPVTLISGAPTPETNAECLSAGALTFLCKPMDAASIAGLKAIVEAQARPCVLISDDDPQIIEALERGARRSGLNPVSDSDASRIIELAAHTVPDVIVLDVNQNGVDGRDVLAGLKSNPATRDIRVVILSGLEDQTTRRECLELGADDYVVKPVDPLFFKRLARRITGEQS